MNRVIKVNKEGKAVAYSESAPQSMMQTHKAQMTRVEVREADCRGHF